MLLCSPAVAAPLDDPTPAEPRSRFCCALGRDLPVRLGPLMLPIRLKNVVSVERLGAHHYTGKLPLEERTGLLYTCRGGLIDLGHVRASIDRVAFLYAASVRPRVELGVQGGTGVFVHNATTAEDRRAFAARGAYRLAVWHEQATTRGVGRRPYFAEDFSAGSPEDLYSDALGATIGLAALLDPRPFEEAVDDLLVRHLEALGAVPAGATKTALDRVEGQWWRRGVMVPDGALLLARRDDDGLPIQPWRLDADDAALLGCTANAESLDLPAAPPFTFAVDDAEPGSDARPERPWIGALRLQSIRLMPFELFAGGFGREKFTPSFGLRVRGGEARTWGGDARIVRFATAFADADRGTVFNIVGVEAESLSFCTDADDGTLHGPISAWFMACRPGGVGVGGRLLHAQYDGRTGRTIVRPVELTVDVDLLRNAFTPAWFTRRLTVAAGFGVDDVREGVRHRVIPRAVASLRFDLGDEDGDFGLRVRGSVRQSVTTFADRGIESSLRLVHRLYLGAETPRSIPTALIELGAEIGHAYWADPWTSISDWSLPLLSARDPHTLYGALTVGARFEAITF
ncbi:MAG: DUF4056 domain-containing protein [Deltaproteobacteria bacterium]